MIPTDTNIVFPTYVYSNSSTLESESWQTGVAHLSPILVVSALPITRHRSLTMTLFQYLSLALCIQNAVQCMHTCRTCRLCICSSQMQTKAHSGFGFSLWSKVPMHPGVTLGIPMWHYVVPRITYVNDQKSMLGKVREYMSMPDYSCMYFETRVLHL